MNFFHLFFKYQDQISTVLIHFAKSNNFFFIIIILLKLLVFEKHSLDVCDFKWLEFDTLTRYLTTNTGAIQPLLTCSTIYMVKMEYEWNLCLQVSSTIYVGSHTCRHTTWKESNFYYIWNLFVCFYKGSIFCLPFPPCLTNQIGISHLLCEEI